MRARDSQRSKVYKADDVLNKYATPLTTVKDVEDYVAKVWSSKRIANLYPSAIRMEHPYVKDGRGTRIARGGTWHISIPGWARNSAIVLHELAHTITRRHHGLEVAAHGPEYCEVFLNITLHMMGREAYEDFKKSMRVHRVKWGKKKRTPLSPERKAQLVEQLKWARLKLKK